MAFPISPTNGQQSTIANVVYQYASATNAWTVIPGYANTISATGNISANYFIGNGAALTGVVATGATALTYGTTNITTAPSGNANITIAGTSNVAVFSTGGANIFGYVTATGNVTGNYILGNGALLTGVITSVANINLGTSNVTVVSSGGNITTSVGGTSNVLIVTSTGANVTGYITASGNITGGNLIQGGVRVIKWTTQANTAPVNSVPGDFWYNSYTGIKYQYTNDGTGNTWIDQSAPTTFSTITVGSIVNSNANGVGNIGASGGSFNTVFAKATSAQYADLAEIYEADQDYAPGTVVVFGGDKEITVTDQSHDTRVAGVISTDPAFIMNSHAAGLPVAFTGRVPCCVQGPVVKGDVLVTSSIPGVAQRIGYNYQPGCVLGKSLQTIANNSIQTIEVVVGRF